jgi:hypothetical protein
MTVKLTCGKGAENLSTDEKLVIDKITKEYEDKINRQIGKIDYLEIHLKCHEKEGNVKRFSIEARLAIGKSRFESSSDDWNLNEALHKLMKKLMSETLHKIQREKEDKKKGKLRS